MIKSLINGTGMIGYLIWKKQNKSRSLMYIKNKK